MNSTTTKRIASLLQSEATRKRLSTAEVARRAGASYESTRRKLTGQGALSVDELIAYSEAVGLAPDYILSIAMSRGDAA